MIWCSEISAIVNISTERIFLILHECFSMRNRGVQKVRFDFNPILASIECRIFDIRSALFWMSNIRLMADRMSKIRHPMAALRMSNIRHSTVRSIESKNSDPTMRQIKSNLLHLIRQNAHVEWENCQQNGCRIFSSSIKNDVVWPRLSNVWTCTSVIPTNFCELKLLLVKRGSITTRRKMDIQDQYLDIQLCDKHLTYLVLISKYPAIYLR